MDDDSTARTVTALSLTVDGYSVLEADSAAAAMELLMDLQPDAVVLDLHMPGTSGAELAVVLRQSDHLRAVPIVFVSADDSDTARMGAFRAGATDYVLKPVPAGELAARVGAQIGLARTWNARVSELQERTQTVARLASLPADLDARSCAQLICEEVSRAHANRACSLLAWVGPAKTAVEIGSAGGGLSVYPGDRSLAGRAWTGNGAWVQDLVKGRTSPVTAVCAPISHRGLVVGVLVIETPDGSPAPLAAAVDFAATASLHLGQALRTMTVQSRRRDSIRAVLAGGGFGPAFQPIVDLRTGTVVGHEALTRLDSGVPVMQLLDEADSAGLRDECELILMRCALDSALDLDGWVSVNLSPSVITNRTDAVSAIVSGSGAPVVLELTENEPINDYPAVIDALRRIGPNVRLSVDDAGSGYASLRHVIDLRPQFMKLDRNWISGIESDRIRQALVGAMVAFCERSGTELIAEGVETPDECDVLRQIGVRLGQGFLLGRPLRPGTPASEALSL